MVPDPTVLCNYFSPKHKINVKRFGSFMKTPYLCSRNPPLYANYLGQL